MHIINIANQKGGVGKSTTAINLSSELCRKHKVLVIDLDPQGNCSKVLLGASDYEFEETIAAFFDKPKAVGLDSLIKPAVCNDAEIDNLYVIPADFQLSRIIETSLTKINRERILSRGLAKLTETFDFVILDTPPNLSLTALNAIESARLNLIPIDSGAFSLDGVTPLLEAVEEIKEEGFDYRFLRNEVDSRNRLINEFIDEELREVSENTLKTVIRRSEDIGQASAVSMPLRFYKKGSLANNDYSSLAKEIRALNSM
ncbi:ParA family protein [Vibrio sp. WXL210]|uniref:ParA family protein n=1 Tax=Vibrio sp. WXL210 TaxID=3450709 RepID=UPI003EC75E52